MVELGGQKPKIIREAIFNCRNSIIFNLEHRNENNLTKESIEKSAEGFRKRHGFTIKIGPSKTAGPYGLIDGSLKPVFKSC